ncbi:MAG: PP2C family protein-serine/threonine phosphatase [Planctomycetota bacterium]
MLGSTLLIITDTPQAQTAAREAAEAMLSAVAEDARPELETASTHELLANQVDLTGNNAAWLWSEGHESDDYDEFALIAALQEKVVPAAITRPAMSEALGQMIDSGVVACPADAEPAAMWAMWSGLFATTPMMQALSMESRMLRAQSSGMAGQFDKIDEELRMACKIQREFLPKELPDPEGLGFDVLWRPASYVSGDIYDVMRLDEHHVGMFIADAVGHGVPAALVSIFIKQSIKTRQITPGIGAGYRVLPPGEALATLNKAMIELDAGSASLGTAAYGVIDTRTQRLTVARAGHPAPLLLRGDGQTEWLEPDGAMLGIFAEEVFEELVIDLEDGDRFLLYSDGFEVAFPGRGDKGRLANEHFTKEFEGLRNGTGQEALEHLQGLLDLQSGSLNQRDDLTVICSSVKANADVEQQRAAMDRPDARSVA